MIVPSVLLFIPRPICIDQKQHIKKNIYVRIYIYIYFFFLSGVLILLVALFVEYISVKIL